MYYAGLRPEEAIAVTLADCRLPSAGWGRLVLHRTLPQAGKRWADTGLNHDERGLKNRRPGDTRMVPLPPHLVAMWRESVTTFGTADDGRLLFSDAATSSATPPTTTSGAKPAPSPCHLPSPPPRSPSALTT
ncbi:hypothetical protein ABT034_15785 [Streptomyces sp. NPDC002773]|uniref:hypothetical protein n=1 Tax=Streptomyces sp. NPDC002773 TaxID=3154430 RepID=UPI003332E5A7